MSNEKYEVMCEMWIKNHTWTLSDAISILCEEFPEVYSLPINDEDFKTKELIATLAKNNLGGLIDIQPSIPSDSSGTIRVTPIQFLEWFESLGFELPTILKQTKHNYSIDLNMPTRKLLPSQIHKHRARAIAEYFWYKNPEVTKAAMARNSELIKFACESKHYSPLAIEQWIKDLNPDRTQGRRKSQ